MLYRLVIQSLVPPSILYKGLFKKFLFFIQFLAEILIQQVFYRLSIQSLINSSLLLKFFAETSIQQLLYRLAIQTLIHPSILYKSYFFYTIFGRNSINSCYAGFLYKLLYHYTKTDKKKF